jgi:heme exporter protein B
MLFLGLVLVVLIELQLDLPIDEKQGVICGLLWLDVFFAGTLALERSMAGEREEGCWRTLLLYPISPSVVFVAKLAVNFVALVLLELVLIPAFVIFANAPLAAHPLMLGSVILLGNLGFVAVGVVASALTSHAQRGGLLALILLPLLTPVLVGAAQATRLAMIGSAGDEWWSWLQLLGAFSVLYTALGFVLFPFAIEE